MKSYIKSYLIAVLSLSTIVLFSCDNGLDELSLNVIATPSTVGVGDSVEFEIVGMAETFAIFTGDSLHNYDSSFLAIAAGQELDLGALVLTNTRLNIAAPWIEVEVIDYNEYIKDYNENLKNDTTIEEEEKVYQDTVVYEHVMENLSTLIVGQEYRNVPNAVYEVASVIFGMRDLAQSLVEDFFQDNGEYLAPEGGFHTGVPLNRYNLRYSYAYKYPGTYTVTVIATGVSNKQYSGSGYNGNRTASASEYNFERLIKQVQVTVQ